MKVRKVVILIFIVLFGLMSAAIGMAFIGQKNDDKFAYAWCMANYNRDRSCLCFVEWSRANLTTFWEFLPLIGGWFRFSDDFSEQEFQAGWNAALLSCGLSAAEWSDLPR